MSTEFHNFFEAATGYPPYPYQERLATAVYLPHMIKIPTGMGKTDAVILSWLWRRRFDPRLNVRSATPRRLVYCLPMRVLVEQVKERAEEWLKNLGMLASGPGDDSALDGWSQKHDGGDKRIAVTVLMGGEDANEWDLYPERDCIIIGTQDMLLSRALNRGYGMSRYRWPMHFGLLNNDCLWVMDEVQLMGAGFTTSVQLQAFRDTFGTIWPASVHTIWMSATIEREWLSTVDFRCTAGDLKVFYLDSNDLDVPSVKKRMNALKVLKRANSTAGDAKRLAGEVLEKHIRGTRTLVILNTVKRAVDLYQELTRRSNGFRILLIHSQFRPLDRKKVLEDLMKTPDASGGTIVVSTQVVEAGVDVSARTMFTELAPWPSLIQRFGRCNRFGEYTKAEIYWIDTPESKKGNEFALPYSIEDLNESRRILKNLDGQNVGPGSLPQNQLQFVHKKIIRRKDLVELFDTTPDLAGTNIDVSRFIRETNDTDVQVFWRDVNDVKEEMFPHKDELCPVPLGDIRELIKNGGIAWYWDHLEGSWAAIGDPMQIIPGMIIMLRASDGRYSPEIGWNPKSKDPVPVVRPEITKRAEGYEDNPTSTGEWQTIAEHTDKVVQVATCMLESFVIDGMWKDTLLEAARWHDSGKAHPSFQAMVKTDAPARMSKFPVAKAPEDAWMKGRLPDRPLKYDLRRRHFRHELASAILALMNGKSDLVSYLVAAHHGKVRMSIRSMPGEYRPPDGGRFARGVWEGDVVPEIDLGGGIKVPKTSIDLSYMDLGDGPRGPSWLSRIIALRDDPTIGPFRLSYLEALIKAFDERASRGES